MPSAGATVVLVPQTPRRPDLFKTAMSDAGGNFAFRGVAPGDYKVFAWEQVPNNAWMNQDFMRKYDALGQILAVRAGNSVDSLLVDLIEKGPRR
jgi:hypothetical protein